MHTPGGKNTHLKTGRWGNEETAEKETTGGYVVSMPAVATDHSKSVLRDVGQETCKHVAGAVSRPFTKNSRCSLIFEKTIAAVSSRLGCTPGMSCFSFSKNRSSHFHPLVVDGSGLMRPSRVRVQHRAERTWDDNHYDEKTGSPNK